MSFEILGVGEALWDMLPAGPMLGGAPCNFAFHCNQLGHRAAILSRIGADPLGQTLRQELRRLRVSDALVQADPVHPTGTVFVHLDAYGKPSYTISEEVAWDYIDNAPTNDLSSVQVICFGTLAQRHEVSRNSILSLLRQSRADGVARIHIFDVNLRQRFYSERLLDASLRLSDWVKVNEEELEVLADLFELQGHSVESRIAELRSRYDLKLACMTRGERGCLVQTASENVDVNGIEVQVADTVGAGDAFTAALATMQLEGKSIAASARFANRYAAKVAASVGGTPAIDRKSIEHE